MMITCVFPLAASRIERVSQRLLNANETMAYFWMIETIDGQHVGYINTFDCDRRVGRFKYAVMIKRPFWRRGYAREAVTLVLRYYFRELRYQKVAVLVYSFNEQSIRLHQALGFSLDGRLR